MLYSKNIRIIARLDIKAPNLIKGIHLEGVRVVGDPQAYAEQYYLEGADELLYIDAVASLYERNSLVEIVKKTASKVFVPMTVGGGIRSSHDVQRLLDAGADKIAINTAAVKNPQLIKELSRTFGAQCIVLSVDAKQTSEKTWEAYIDGGREKTGVDVIEWVKMAQELGAGEVLLTSVDREGTRKGFDLDLIKQTTAAVDIPIIASGGMGSLSDFDSIVVDGGADAVAMAHVLHYNQISLPQIKEHAKEKGINVRPE